MVSDRTWRNLRNELSRSFVAKLGVALIVAIILAGIFAPLVAPHNPNEQNLDNKRSPPVGMTVMQTETRLVTEGLNTTEKEVTVYYNGSLTHPLGTDPLGRDIFSRIIYGARTSLTVALLSTFIGMCAGTASGLISGYFRGWVDDVIMRAVDVALALPGLMIAVVLIGVIGPTSIRIPDPIVMAGLAPGMPKAWVFPGTVTAVIAILSWNEFTRISRGEALWVREEDYVRAAESLGARRHHVIGQHMLPNAFSPVLVYWTIRIAAAILIESTLSFLGFTGTSLSWGYDIGLGQDYLASSWWVAVFPGLGIVLAVIGINLVGDWLRDALDPGLQKEGSI